MMHLLGYTLVLFFGQQDLMVVLATFVISLSLVMVLFSVWRYRRGAAES